MTWPTVYVEAAFGHVPASALSTYTWTDITSRVSSINVQSPSRSKFIEPLSPGQLTVRADNSDGALDPFATSGTYTSGGVSLVRPNLPLRVRVVYSSTTYYLFTGYLDTAEVVYQDPSMSEVVLSATDAFKLFTLQGLSDDVFPSQSTASRIGALLDATDWPSADRDIATGLSIMAGRTTSPDAKALSELQLAQEHEHGLFYMSGAGLATFRARDFPWLLKDAYQFSDASGSLDYVELEAACDLDSLVNTAMVANSGGTVYYANDATSMGKYGARSWSKIDYEYVDDAQVNGWAQAVVDYYSEHTNRLIGMTVEPTVNDSLWTPVLNATVGYGFLITRTPTSGSAYSRSVLVDGVTHDISTLGSSAQGRWVTRYDLTDITSWPDVDLAGWDVATWGSSEWFY